ncbi:unnamed protein product [Owenia fusiformis]|uniref:Uncharacterized protein n=1 Tax=Owenia fusiformis TaxID=6347 RepID=A0A8S4NUK0_OWEFU|nr:unnamed protein product [Owenia fusiformis]
MRKRSTIMVIFTYLMLASVILVCSLVEQSNAAVLRVNKNVAKLNQITGGDLEVESEYSENQAKAQDTRETVSNQRSKRSAHLNFSAMMPGPRFHKHRGHRRHLKSRRNKSRSPNVRRRITAGGKGTWTWLPAYKRYAWLPEEKPDKDDSFSKLMRYGK